KHKIEKGENIYVHPLSENKVLVKDGDYFVASKGEVGKIEQVGKKFGSQLYTPEEQKVEEVVKREPSEDDIDIFLNDEAGQGQTREEAREYLQKDEGGVKFKEYILPGGENYQEVLIKAPLENKSSIKWNEFKKRMAKKYGEGHTVDSYTPEEDTERIKLSRTLQKAIMTKGASEGFKSSHWDEPNVLAHTRLTDRKTADGKKVLFVEEIQSDWAKKARSAGAKGEAPVITDKTDTQIQVNNQWYHKRIVEDTGLDFDKLKIGDKLKEFDKNKDFPFHPLLKNWKELAIKKVLEKAVQGGYDAISWTTGQQQADRYDLSKKISGIDYLKEPEGEYWINVIDLDDNVMGDVSKRYSLEEIEKTFGKDIKAKIEKNVGDGLLSGLDLKIGGEWAKSLYDVQIPSILKKLTKGEIGEIKFVGDTDNETIILLKDAFYKYDNTGEYSIGDLVESVDNILKDSDKTYKELEIAVDNYKGAVAEDRSEWGMRGDVDSYVDDFENTLTSFLKASSFDELGNKKIAKLKQQSLTITPEIKRMVLGDMPKGGGKVHKTEKKSQPLGIVSEEYKILQDLNKAWKDSGIGKGTKRAFGVTSTKAGADTKESLVRLMVEEQRQKDLEYTASEKTRKFFDKYVDKKMAIEFLDKGERGKVGSWDMLQVAKMRGLGKEDTVKIAKGLYDLARVHRNRMEQAFEMELDEQGYLFKEHNDKIGYIDNYLPHIFKNTKKAQEVFRQLSSKLSK
ncbi:hypothetical protein KJ918_06275, partial [Patescibacteria group bacterium]|nr:hypothetical protein [Patescibacteria group bacterium]